MGLSETNADAGCVVSPSRSRTMLLYSTREIRRTGDQSTVGVPGCWHSDALLMSAVLSGPGAATPAAPPSAPAGASSMSGVARPVVAQPPAEDAAAPRARTSAVGKART